MPRITTTEGMIPTGSEAEAAAKLCRLKDFVAQLNAEINAVGAEMSRLRAQDATKSARFRELLGYKLLLTQMLTRLKQARLAED